MATNRTLMLLLLLTLPVLAEPALVLERFYPASADTSYQYVPFVVPAGTREIHVRYSYQDRQDVPTGWALQSPESAVDIGLFDSRGLGDEGFRGWSGGKRKRFKVGLESATPGYLPGPMPEGEWALILGLYRVAPGGVTIRVEIDFSRQESPGLASPPSPQMTRERGDDWYKGDLHLHTVHSDGDRTMQGLARELESSRLDFLALTEHNTSSHHRALPPTDRFLLLGEEVTTFAGHYNVWGLPQGKWLDFRCSFEEILAQARSVDALVSINHPYALCKGCGWDQGFQHDFDTLEVWNGPWDATDEAALELWDRLLRRGRRITAVASSDSHKPEQPLGHPCTAIRAPSLTQASLFQGLRAGSAVLLARPDLEPLEVEITTEPDQVSVHLKESEQYRVVVVHAEGRKVYEPGPNRQLRLSGHPSQLGYLRLELRDEENRVLQLTNPVYLDRR